MQVILVRHGSREHRGHERDDSKAPLTAGGRDEIEQLAKALHQLEAVPTVCLTSKKAHAKETGRILTGLLGGGPLVELGGLQRTTAALALLSEAENNGVRLSPSDVVVIVGHEPALGQLTMNLTSHRQRPLLHGEALCLAADGPVDFLKGKGGIDYRQPAVDYQEASLREKIRSKAHIATFLAGFTFSTLIELLLGSDPRSGFRIAAIICLTLALALFVAAVYVYDTLGMPEGFWLYGERSRLQVALLRVVKSRTLLQPLVRRARNQRKEPRERTFRRHGPLYVYMVSTWTIVFTPAVLLALAGFIALVVDTNDWKIYVGAAISLVIASAFYWRIRPDLGVD